MKREKAVPALVRRLMERLAEAGLFREFYLAGGTGLALLIGHRRSVDLDFFSRANHLDSDGRRSLLIRLKPFREWELLEAKEGTVQGRIGAVRVSFFWYPEPLVGPLVRKGAVRIASFEDIGLMKLAAVIGRGSRKDFVDLYAICRRVPLERLLALGPRKFKDVRDFPLQALKALCYFDDAQREPPVVSPRPVSWDRVEAFFSRSARSIGGRYLRRAHY